MLYQWQAVLSAVAKTGAYVKAPVFAGEFFSHHGQFFKLSNYTIYIEQYAQERDFSFYWLNSLFFHFSNRHNNNKHYLEVNLCLS